MIRYGIRIVAAGALLALAANSRAEATVVYNNANIAATQAYRPSAHGGAFYASFSTSSSLVTADVLLGLQGGNSNTSHFVVTLHSDSSTLPGAQLAQLGDVLDSQISANGIYDFHFQPQTLSAGRYWIEVADAGNAFWNSNGGNGVTNLQYWVAAAQPTVANANSSSGINWQMCVSDSSTACNATVVQSFGVSVPEPASLALLSVALVGLGLVSRRWRT